MNKDQHGAELVDLGVASVETKGAVSGLPEDISSAQQTGIDDE